MRSLTIVKTRLPILTIPCFDGCIGHFADQSYHYSFYLVGRDSTKRRYRNLWKRLTYFVTRLYVWSLPSARSFYD
jgi:hypothetical protein